jgi:hypothetical protein
MVTKAYHPIACLSGIGFLEPKAIGNIQITFPQYLKESIKFHFVKEIYIDKYVSYQR